MTVPPSNGPTLWDVERALNDLRESLRGTVTRDAYDADRRAGDQQFRILSQQITDLTAQLTELRKSVEAEVDKIAMTRDTDLEAARRRAAEEENRRVTDRRMIIFSFVVPVFLVFLQIYLATRSGR